MEKFCQKSPAMRVRLCKKPTLRDCSGLMAIVLISLSIGQNDDNVADRCSTSIALPLRRGDVSLLLDGLKGRTAL